MSLTDVHTLEPKIGTAESPSTIGARLAARFAETAASRACYWSVLIPSGCSTTSASMRS